MYVLLRCAPSSRMTVATIEKFSLLLFIVVVANWGLHMYCLRGAVPSSMSVMTIESFGLPSHIITVSN